MKALAFEFDIKSD